ncbi:failed axon connections homolog isoform X2 [Saccostrea echinata]|uniref:failed axon connections homolog isoform X2 n=1 Tax=Saccostrea echinata TaxID=191078 RepID=UPI002A8326A6|nr:failed axon connections homolog isoform X2 [Saccostrea echinata]
MEDVKTFMVAHLKEICGAAVIGFTVMVVYKRCKRKIKKSYPRDTVIHHTIPRGPFAPSLTPFALKLETYLRMAKVPYQNEFDSVVNRNSKGKLTWIEYNGEEVADSEFCIKFINKTLNIDLDKDFTDEEKAIAYSFQKVAEEYFYWALFLQRWVYDGEGEVFKYIKIPWIFRKIGKRGAIKQAHAQRIGRHSQEEVQTLIFECLQNFSSFLGKKKFLLGEKPCQADCAVFGILSQCYWHGFGSFTEQEFKKFENLCSYCERMKAEFWPDWDDCITHGDTREATK